MRYTYITLPLLTEEEFQSVQGEDGWNNLKKLIPSADTYNTLFTKEGDEAVYHHSGTEVAIGMHWRDKAVNALVDSAPVQESEAKAYGLSEEFAIRLVAVALHAEVAKKVV